MSKEGKALEKTRIRYMQMTGCNRETAEKRVAQLLTQADNQNKKK